MHYAMMKDTPIGTLTLVSDSGHICKCAFGVVEESGAGQTAGSCEDERVLRQALSELEEYFCGDRRQFTVPVRFHGPAFHERVWRHLAAIPFGQAETYGEIAAALGSPGAARAVGNACAKNPVAVIVPCHRVLAQGGIGGFGGGLDAKTWLLRHEGVRLPE